MATLLSDACFDVPAKIPFPPGASPFRQKGHVYRGNHDFIKKVIPGGLPAVIERLPSPELKKFFEQRFTVSDWYDSLPNMYLQNEVARMRGISLPEQAMQNGVHHAQERIKGFASMLLKVVSTESVAVWAPRVPSMYYSYGKFRTQIIGEKRVALWIEEIPTMIVRWIGAVFAGTGGEMIRSAGGKNVNVTFPVAEPDGQKHGMNLWRINGEVTWE